MLAYWSRDIEKQGGKRKALGACAPRPRASRTCEWPRLLETDLTPASFPGHPGGASKGGSKGGVTRHPLLRVINPWESLEAGNKPGGPSKGSPPPKKRKKATLPPKGERQAAARKAYLEVPEERHQRFFLTQGMTEFKNHLQES